MSSFIALIIGIFLGWFFLPTPAWATGFMMKVAEKLPFIKAFMKK